MICDIIYNQMQGPSLLHLLLMLIRCLNFLPLVILLLKTREQREVTQYHYVSWPDHGSPTTTSLVVFWRYVTSQTRDRPAPLLVHCRFAHCVMFDGCHV